MLCKEAFKIRLKEFFKKVAVSALAIPLVSFYSVNSPVADAAGEEREIVADILYYCESVTNFDMPVKVYATAPTYLEPGEVNYSKNSYTEVTIPFHVVDILRDLLKVDAVSGTVTRFDVISENTNKTINVADLYDIEFPFTETPSSGSLTIRVPASGGFDVGPFEAGQSGEMVFKAGQIDTNLIAHSSALGDTPLPAKCYPKPGQDPTIVKIPISSTGDPGDPSDPPGGDPSDPPGGDPSDPPGGDPGDQPGGEPGDQPGGEPGDQPGGDPGDQPGDEPGDQPGDKPSDKPGKDSGDTPKGGSGGLPGIGLDDDSDRTGFGSSSNVNKSGSGGLLPKTATNNPLLIMLGSLIAIAGGVIAFFRKKKALTE